MEGCIDLRTSLLWQIITESQSQGRLDLDALNLHNYAKFINTA